MKTMRDAPNKRWFLSPLVYLLNFLLYEIINIAFIKNKKNLFLQNICVKLLHNQHLCNLNKHA